MKTETKNIFIVGLYSILVALYGIFIWRSSRKPEIYILNPEPFPEAPPNENTEIQKPI